MSLGYSFDYYCYYFLLLLVYFTLRPLLGTQTTLFLTHRPILTLYNLQIIPFPHPYSDKPRPFPLGLDKKASLTRTYRLPANPAREAGALLATHSREGGTCLNADGRRKKTHHYVMRSFESNGNKNTTKRA